MKIIIKGLISSGDYGDDYDVLYVEEEEPLLKFILDKIDEDNWEGEERFKSSFNYLVSDKPIEDIEIAKADYFSVLEGNTEIEYFQNYSECTGYLWTDSKLNVGGHDLLEELENYVGKYIYLEIIIYDDIEVEE